MAGLDTTRFLNPQAVRTNFFARALRTTLSRLTPTIQAYELGPASGTGSSIPYSRFQCVRAIHGFFLQTHLEIGDLWGLIQVRHLADHS